MYLDNESLRPVPEIEKNLVTDISTQYYEHEIAALDPLNEELLQTKKMAQIWSSRLKSILSEQHDVLNSQIRSCSKRDLPVYLEALFSMGRFEDCVKLALDCQQSGLNQRSGLQAAQCATAINQWPVALAFYESSQKRGSKIKNIENHFIFSYAAFLLNSPFANRAEEKIKLISELPAASVDTLMKAVKYFIFKKSPPEGTARLWLYLDKAIQNVNPQTKSFFTYLKTKALFDQYKYQEARDFLNANLNRMTRADYFWPLGYNLLYSNKFDLFKLADIFYKAYLPYAHWRAALPNENNTYNYTEVYSKVCKNNTLPADVHTNYMQKLQLWQTSQLSTDEFSNWLQSVLLKYKQAADVLTTLGSLELLKSNNLLAQNYFWKAHEFCPYYNRAHWGLVALKRQAKNESFTEYAELESNLLKSIENIDYGQNIHTYVLNYANLSVNIQNKLKFGSRIWGPYFDQLNAANNTIYIKFAFELLSQTPDLSELRDARIGGENYPNDNRLWDDVRGAGGKTVIADFGELNQIAQGEYNTIGHEVSHQFHHFIMKKNQSLKDCIENLYNEALKRNTFADGYAAQNQQEYFAQAVTYYLVPEKSPERFGLNRGWFKANDREVLNLVESIENSQGQIDRIRCAGR